MNTVSFKGKIYEVDFQGFLIDFKQWDEDFAEGMAPKAMILHGLTKEHWDLINFVRNTFQKEGRCPLVYRTCRQNGLRINEMKLLFPSGYLRGTCKLAGITYKEGFAKQSSAPISKNDIDAFESCKHEKKYTVDVRGFLVNPSEWDEQFALWKAIEMKMPTELTDTHWKIIHYLRQHFIKNNIVPTVYQTCEAHNLQIEELETLFPDGFHRGAVKIAGLRVI